MAHELTRPVPILGLAGPIASGKDAVAEAIIARWPTTWYRVAFADALRAVVTRLWPDVGRFARQRTTGLVARAPARTYRWRWLLQEVGEALRTVDEEVWVEALKREIASVWARRGPEVRFVVPDVRYANECDAIEELGGYVVRLRVSPDVQLERLRARGEQLTRAQLAHISEVQPIPLGVPAVETDGQRLEDVVANVLTLWDEHWRAVMERGHGSQRE